ncbi:uncharacterized protein LOC134077643 [Sardina pilchardus]|uniref:uncharacterized protein LOC134077643 n=1 Tax=Sardina pilchardus TaxID=27697 RepID=UPI002E125C81
MEDSVDRVGSARFVTKLDLLKGYWQVPVTPRAAEISAFVTPDSFLQYSVMPFGLRNAPGSFQRLMCIVLAGVQNCEVYLDDIVLHSSTWSSHLELIHTVFHRLQDASLTLNLAKCEFGKATVTYLGKQVGQGQVRPVEAKIQAIVEFPIPKTKREVRRFLGMAGYYRLSGWSVTYTPQSICALKGSSVELHSYYTYPCDHTVSKAFWFTTSGTGNEDLREDVHYQGRVNYTENNNNSHTLSIRNLTLTDAKTYTFSFVTDKEGGKYSGGNVELTVTGLQVLVNNLTVKEGDNVTLTCNTTCSLSTNSTYIWYRNSQPLSNSHTTSGSTLPIPSFSRVDNGNYSCAVRGHEAHPSPPLCLSGWSVTYTPQSICALKGSSVELHSYYTYPCDHTVTKAFWFTTSGTGKEDLREDVHYQGRVNYTENNNNSHTLSIRNLTLADAKTYTFSFSEYQPHPHLVQELTASE